MLPALRGIDTELSIGDDESDLLRALREIDQQNTHRAGQRMTERNLNL